MGCGCGGKRKAVQQERRVQQAQAKPKEAPPNALKGPAAPGYTWQGQPQPEQEG